MSTQLTRILVATNVALVLNFIYRDGPGIRRWFRKLYQRCAATPGDSSPGASPSRSSLSLIRFVDQDYVPPLPKPVADALERSSLCYLATAGGTGSEPHLSLMRFTFTVGLEEKNSEVLIISTRKDTKKYDLITRNENVALLVHDFDAGIQADERNYKTNMDGSSRYSITLNGVVKVQEGELAERYRKIHLASNESYSQFIVGDQIAIITVNLKRARVCDVNDRVLHYERAEGALSGQAWSEVNWNAGGARK
eukprot:CAMPEP_0115866148 /NCGR_PEP_ID=MMETSP0287-20121206/20099_1 /TAXON_ID=412157 /ORGANISM="Chrysochromulina rotalis, Strain UIO044" /LENGTH=251 /DNA_ID=CAMNT_0003320705 /DNA_START=63 /DNA_END=818 /DNA_ORIENTATION=-